MRHPAYVSLRELPTASLTQVGEWGQLLGKLVSSRIPVTASSVIPTTVLWEIAEANQLAAKLAQTNEPSAQKKLFTSLVIPRDIAADWVKLINTELLDEKITTTVSWLPHLHQSPLSITARGDANVIESLLELWASAYQAQSGTTEQKIVPGALVLQLELPNTQAGFTLTHAEDEAKQTITLHWQSDPAATLVIDVRTWHIIAQSSAAAFANLPPAAWIELAHHLQTIRLWSLHNYLITWKIYRHQFFIAHIATAAHTQPSAAIAHTPYGTTAIRGRSAIAGKVKGVVVTRLHQLTTHGVLVTRSLETLSPQAATFLAAAIIETHISPPALSLLQKYHVPVIINATGATQRFQAGQSVLVDATNGIASLQQNTARLSIRKNTQWLYTSANQPLAEESYPQHDINGILFRPEVTLTNTGVHPLHIIRSHQRETLLKQLTTTMASYRQLNLPLLYRLSSLTSDQLRSLTHGEMYEPQEANPRLGFFGGLRSVTNPELLDFELTALTRIAPTFHQPLGIVVSSCRSSSELKALTNHIQRYFSSARAHRLWWEVTTPEHIFNPQPYLATPIDGVIINVLHLHALSLGIDPANQDVYHRYMWSESLITEWVSRLQTQVGDKPVMLYIPEDRPEIFSLVKQLNLRGLIVKASHASVAATYL